MPRIGVLALQGDYLAHVVSLRGIGVVAHEVRRPGEVDGLNGLVIPGGESTTLLNLMDDEPWFERIRAFHDEGGSLFGTCAGAVLLSKTVVHPEQPSLGLLDAVIERNAYGRQRESFETRLDVPELGDPFHAVFIRAPRFRSVGPGVQVLCRMGDDPVLVRKDGILAGTFHPELTDDNRLHRHFAEMAASGNPRVQTGRRVVAAS